jgi:Nucleoside 2-deoxyribosyltransferase like
MRIITAPQPFIRTKIQESSVFLAGGISNCPNWQEILISHIKFAFSGKDNLVILNPRRDDFDVSKKEETTKQIKWEHEALEQAGTILFWFPKDTLCPITLFELGNYLEKKKNIIIGVDPKYARKYDVEYQTYIRRPEVAVAQNWERFLEYVSEHLKSL